MEKYAGIEREEIVEYVKAIQRKLEKLTDLVYRTRSPRTVEINMKIGEIGTRLDAIRHLL